MPSTRLGRIRIKKAAPRLKGKNALNGQAGRLTLVTRRGGEGVCRRILAGSWVALLLAILGFLVIYPLLTLLLGVLTATNPVVDGLNHLHGN